MNTAATRTWDRIAVVMGLFLLFAGVMHFASPGFFNDIVPPWLPPSRSFWTYASGVAEIVVAFLVLRRSTRRIGAVAAAWLFVAVYPANIYMTWDWRDHVLGDRIVSWVRLPFQFLFIWIALKIVDENTRTDGQPG